MLKIIFDHDFNHDIRRGLQFRLPTLDFVTAHEIGLNAVHDRRLLTWAAANERLMITHDRRSMPDHFAEILIAGKHVSGIVVVPQRMRILTAVNELELIIVKSDVGDWLDRIHILSIVGRS